VSPVSSICLASAQAADARVTSAASDVARDAATGSADLPRDFVTLSTAKVQVAATVAVERASQQMQKTLLDLFA